MYTDGGRLKAPEGTAAIRYCIFMSALNSPARTLKVSPRTARHGFYLPRFYSLCGIYQIEEETCVALADST